MREKASGQKCTQRDDVVGCFGCSHPLVDGSLQLFGRAPMAAFNGDAAQTERERKETVRGEEVCFFQNYRFV